MTLLRHRLITTSQVLRPLDHHEVIDEGYTGMCGMCTHFRHYVLNEIEIKFEIRGPENICIDISQE